MGPILTLHGVVFDILNPDPACTAEEAKRLRCSRIPTALRIADYVPNSPGKWAIRTFRGAGALVTVITNQAAREVRSEPERSDPGRAKT